MPTSSQYRAQARDQAAGSKSPSAPGKLKKSVYTAQNSKVGVRPPHHKSDPSLAMFSTRKAGIQSATPVRTNGLRRSRSVLHLNKKENLQEEKDKPLWQVQRGQAISQLCTPIRRGVSHCSRQLLPSSGHVLPENHDKHLKDQFSCAINVTVTATPDCLSKVSVETPRIREGISNLLEIGEMESSNLTVGVRVRPLSSREKSDPAIWNVVSVYGNEIMIKGDSGMMHTFIYDHCFLSEEPLHPQNADQETVFSTMVYPLIDKMFEGYNACLFAYGQTGSGKTYSMMGVDSDGEAFPASTAGIIPRFCHDLFLRISENEKSAKTTTKVEISYFEIYNEKIHDLLGGSSEVRRKTPLRVREHPVLGPYVEDLSVHQVTSLLDLKGWLRVGRSQRATAATEMNEKSSRSHSIFSVILTQLQEETVLDEHHIHNRRSKINLVDLAGSERLAHTGASGGRLREGVSVNRSLLTLGKVISALSEQSSSKKKVFIQYRESVLTWLLRESLGGNSRTAMLATISPSAAHMEETLSTLRYACQARSIVNRARVNESPADRLIRELRAEVERLMALREEVEIQKTLSPQKLEVDGEVLQEISRKEQEIIKLKEQLQHKRQQFQSDEDIALSCCEHDKSEELKVHRHGVAISLDWKEQQPCLVNLCPSPTISSTLFYLLPPGEVQVGRSLQGQQEPSPDISLSGPLVQANHCSIVNEDGRLHLSPCSEGQTFVNGQVVTQPTELRHGDRLVLGGSHCFRVHNPLESLTDCVAEMLPEPVDYQFAQLEVCTVREEKLQRELDEVKKGVEKDLTEAKERAAKELEEVKKQAKKELEEVEKQAKKELEEVRKQAEKEQEEVKKEAKKELEEVKMQARKDLVEMKEQTQKKLVEMKEQAQKELEEAKFEAESKISSQKTMYERELQRLQSLLEEQKAAVLELEREGEELQMEKGVLQVEVQKLDLEESFAVMPYTSDFLEELKKILSEPMSTNKRTAELEKEASCEMLIQEAKKLCKELGVQYDFRQQIIVGGKSLRRAVLVKNSENRKMSFWDPSYFAQWLRELRQIGPGESARELLDNQCILWEDGDAEKSDSKEDSHSSVKPKTNMPQLDTSFLRQSIKSCADSLEDCYTKIEDTCDGDFEGITEYVHEIRDNMQDLWGLYDSHSEDISEVFYELDSVVKDCRSALKIPDESSDSSFDSSDTDSPYRSAEPIEVIESTCNTPAKSSLKSPAVCDASTPKTPKSVRFKLPDSDSS